MNSQGFIPGGSADLAVDVELSISAKYVHQMIRHLTAQNRNYNDFYLEICLTKIPFRNQTLSVSFSYNSTTKTGLNIVERKASGIT